MDQKILKLNKYHLAFDIDEKLHLIYIYHLTRGKCDDESKSILKTINSVLAKELEDYFNIAIDKYGVAIDSSLPRAITKEEKAKIYSYRPVKFLFGLFLAFIVYSLLFPDEGSSQPMQEMLKNFAYLSLVVVVLAFALLIGKEQFLLERFKNHLINNITTVPLPSMEDKLYSLEDKVEDLEEMLRTNNANSKKSI